MTSLAAQFRTLATKALTPVADRDALARELAGLQANPPAFVDIYAPVTPAHACPGCNQAAQEATERRVVYAAHAARVAALRAQLFRLSFGGPEELDAPGRALATLRAEIRRAADANQARRWGELESEGDPTRRGKVISTWVSPHVLGEVARDLSRLGSLAADSGPLVYLPTVEIEAAIVQARERLTAIMARPVRVPIDADVAERANVPRHDPLDDSAGLVPSPSDPGVLAGTVRFVRRG